MLETTLKGWAGAIAVGLSILLPSGAVARAATAPVLSPPTAQAPPAALSPNGDRRTVETHQLLHRGQDLIQRGEWGDALEVLLRAERLLETGDDRTTLGIALNNIALAYQNQGQYPEAQGYLERALILHRDQGDRVGEGSVIHNLGELYRLTGQYDRALEHLTRALAINRETRDRFRESVTLHNRGLVYAAQGRYDDALGDYAAARTLNRAIGNRQGEGQALHSMAVVDYSRGRYREALARYEAALAINRTVGHRRDEGAILNNIAAVYHQLGQYKEALARFEATLVIRRETGDRAGEASSLANIGSAHRSLGNYGDALTHFNAALALARTLGDPTREEAILRGIGSVQNLSGQPVAAQDHYEQALRLNRTMGNRAGEGHALQGIAVALHHQGNLTEARTQYQAALAVRRAIGDRTGEASTLRSLGRVHLGLGELAAAEAHLRESLGVAEVMERELGPNDHHRVSFFETWGDAYTDLQTVLVERGQPEAALEAADQARARSLADFLRPGPVDQGRSPLSLQQMRQMARDRGATLVLYSVLEQELFAWVVAPDGAIGFRRLNPAAVGIPIRTAVASTRATATNPVNDSFFGSVESPFSEDWVLRVRSGLTEAAPAIVTDGKEGLQQGYRLLIEPLEDLLPQQEGGRVILIPHRELGMLPFGALLDSQDRFLLERFTLSIAPSLQVLAALPVERSGGGGLLAVGNPDPMPLHNGERLTPLAGAAHEAKTIAALFNADPLLAGQATETAVKGRLRTADLLHFATHGIFQLGDRDVLDTWLALAPDGPGGEDGKLTLTEIFDQRLSAQMAVLSACDTGKGRVTGEGVIGLARAFLRAGTPTVVASLWKVPDQQTALLMEEFYRQLLAGRDRAAALRLAQLKVRASYPNPFYWAAFVVIGEGDRPLTATGPRGR